MTTFTIADILTKGLTQAAPTREDKVNAENPYVSIITDVDAFLEPSRDFEFNGRLMVSGLYQDILKKYGTVKIADLGDLRIKHIKVVWSTTQIKECCIDEIYNVSLVVRVTEVDDEVLSVLTLRNDYGDPLQKIIIT